GQGRGGGGWNGVGPFSLVGPFAFGAAACAPASQAPSAPAGGGNPPPPAAATTAPAAPAAAKPAAAAASGTVSVAMVGNPQMKTLEQLKSDFESSHSGVTLNLLVLPENQIRDKVT